MNGPHHYQEAERLLNMLPSHGVNYETGMDRAETFAAAQVHATLALAAVTAEARYTSQQEPWGGTTTYVEHAGVWDEVIS